MMISIAKSLKQGNRRRSRHTCTDIHVSKYSFSHACLCLLPRFIGQGCDLHSYKTRASEGYQSNISRTRLKQFSIKCCGPAILNSFSKEFKTILTIGTFRHRVRTYLIEGSGTLFSEKFWGLSLMIL